VATWLLLAGEWIVAALSERVVSSGKPPRQCADLLVDQYHIERPDLAHCRTTRVMTRCWVQSDEEAMWCLPRRAQGSCFQQREGLGSKNTGFEHTLLISRGYYDASYSDQRLAH
jgi:hypothetical protein